MNDQLYSYLNEWAKNNKIRFWVQWHSSCHTLNVSHVIEENGDDTIVRFVIVEYPHRGGRHIKQPWSIDHTMSEFIDLAEMFWTAIPKQPCGLLGYKVVS